MSGNPISLTSSVTIYLRELLTFSRYLIPFLPSVCQPLDVRLTAARPLLCPCVRMGHGGVPPVMYNRKGREDSWKEVTSRRGPGSKASRVGVGVNKNSWLQSIPTSVTASRSLMNSCVRSPLGPPNTTVTPGGSRLRSGFRRSAGRHLAFHFPDVTLP